MRATTGRTFNPDKSYEQASWDDYVEWLKRIGIEKVVHDKGKGIRMLYKGQALWFSTKKSLFEWILENADV